VTEYRAIHPAFTDAVYAVFDFERSVAARNTKGGTAPSAVEEQIERAKSVLSERA